MRSRSHAAILPAAENGALTFLTLLLLCAVPARLGALELAAVSGLPAAPIAPTPDESELCAKRLLGVVFYTTWQNTFPSPDTPLIFGIFGELSERRLIEQHLRSSLPRPIRFVTVTNEEEAAQCHVVYLPNANASERKTLLQAIEGKPILSIGEFRAPDWPACIIEFVRIPSKHARHKNAEMRTDLNRPPPSSGLSFQAPLLSAIAKQAQATR